MVPPSLFTEYPLGRFVCDTESPERHTKNGVNCSLLLADNTSAKVEFLLRSNETDAPHVQMWDTENYSSLLNTAIRLFSVSLKTRILSFKKFTVILVAPH